jgi:Gpi18-like mannosyltransferase
LWGQCDSIYAAFAVGGVYYVLRQRPLLACVFFGLAFAVKLQAVFLFPLLLVLVFTKRLPWRALLAVPAVYLVLDLPALAVGASVRHLLTVYLAQTDQYPQLTLNAPSVYQFLPSDVAVNAVRSMGIFVTGVLVLTLIGAVVFSRVELTPTRIVLAATVSVIVVPFFLPSMHERYFYLADVFSVIAACYLPRRLWSLPILVQAASFVSYILVLSRMPGGRMIANGSSKDRSIITGPPPGLAGQGPPPGNGLMQHGKPGGNFVSLGDFGSSPEFKYLAGLMACAVVIVLWFAFREFRQGSGQRQEHTESGAA